MKKQACKTVILHKNLESAEFTNKKHGKPTLHSLLYIANHVLQMSAKLKFQCVHVKKKNCFALVVLNWFPICFKAWFPLSHLRPRQLPISSQNEAISVKDDCSTV